MHLVSIDLDPNSRLSSLHLGPFSSGLNAICGPSGTGKSTLLSLARRLLFGYARTDRLVDGERLYGAIQAEDNDGVYRIAASGPSDIQRGGRIEFQPKFGSHSSNLNRSHYHQPNWESNSSSPSWSSHAWAPPAWRSLAPEFYQTLFADPLGSGSIDRLWTLAKDLGVAQRTTRRQDLRFDELRREEADLKDRLKRINYLNHDRAWWVTEQQRVSDRLRESSRYPEHYDSTPWNDIRRLEGLIESAQNEIARLRAQEEELSAAVRDRHSQLHVLEESSRRPMPDGLLILTRRQQLEEIDQRLYNWRQTLREVKQYRDRIEQTAHDLRLDRQLDLAGATPGNPRWGLESLETQILNTRRHLDQLQARQATHLERDRQLFEAALPATFQSMQEDLYEVCQQLSRNEATVAGEKLAAQIEQAKRCEGELELTIERMIEERGNLLQKIADENDVPYDRLSLAVGDWCQCHEHPHLYQWLFGQQLRTPEPSSDNHGRIVELRSDIQSLNQDLLRAQTRLEGALRDCHAYELELKELREKSARLPAIPTLTSAERQDLQRRLSRADEAIAMWDQHAAWSRRLSDVQAELRTRSPYRDEVHDSVSLQAQEYYRQLVGDAYAGLPTWAGNSSWPSTHLWNGEAKESVSSQRVYGEARPLVDLAIRMAIADAIAPQFGRFPLILDHALEGMHGPALDRVIRTLVEYGKRGQQILLTTADEEVASRVRANHGWVCHLKSGSRQVVQPVVDLRYAPPERPMRYKERYQPLDVNSHLNALANEVAGYQWYDEPVAYDRTRTIDIPPAPTYRSSTLNVPQQYFLSERSWVEEVPGIDQRSSSELRRMGLDTVGSLLAADPREVAFQLQSSGITESTVRRWQGESELMCKVPQIRAFDARLLYGSGVTSHRMLATMHPGQLLQKVEAFLATDRGQDILRTGNSYELSRITTWIVSANRNARGRRPFPGFRDVRTELDPRSSSSARSPQRDLNRDPRTGYDRRSEYQPRAEYQAPIDYPTRTMEQDPEDDHRRADIQSRAGVQPRSDGQPHAELRTRTGNRSNRNDRRSRRIRRRDPSNFVSRNEIPNPPQPVAGASKARVVRMRTSDQDAGTTQRPHWKFYLEVDSPIVDAPSIGPRMAQELNAIGILTVADLISKSADQIAGQWNSRKVTPSMIAAWQSQAKLVCCVPNLRGHDAQLLVAAGVTTVEQLVHSPAHDLLSKVTQVAASKDGQRFLRGSKAPDQAEVADWLDWAKHSRTIRAA